MLGFSSKQFKARYNRGVGRAELLGGGAPSSLKFLPGVGLGGGVKFLIYFWEGGGGPGNLETPLATPLRYRQGSVFGL